MSYQHVNQLCSLRLYDLPECMQLTEAELSRHLSFGKYKHFQTVFHHDNGSGSNTYYHLHSDLLVDCDDGGKIVGLCRNCFLSLTAKSPTRPMYNVGNGFDYGSNRHLLPSLSLAEQKACSLVLLTRTVLKINTPGGTVHSAGHSISFAHDSANSIASTLPRTDVCDFIKLTFIGGRTEWQQLAADRNKFLQRYPEFRINVDNIIEFLKIKRVLDPAYSTIPILDDIVTRKQLESITQHLIDSVMLVDDPDAVRLERITTSSIADPTANEPLPPPSDITLHTATVASSIDTGVQRSDTGAIIDDDINASDSSSNAAAADTDATSRGRENATSLTSKEHQRDTVPTDRGNFEHVYVGPSIGQVAASNDRILRGIQTSMTNAKQKSDDAEPTRVYAHVGSTPLCEFTENAFSIMGSQPDVFLLGQGIPVSRSLKTSDYTHMFMQYNHVFTARQELLFHFFNQIQRHAALREVSFRVDKSDPTSDNLFELINQPGFDKRLSDAIKSPLSDDATKLTREITAYVRILGSRVPFSQEERQRYVLLYSNRALVNHHKLLCMHIRNFWWKIYAV